MIDPKERFTNRVDDYVRYRPGYPAALFALLERECGLHAGCRVAEAGAGTGIFALQMLGMLAASGRVFGVEPNAAMRAAAEASLGGDPRFVSVAGSAEATSLPDASVDLVIAAQAFHWFEPAGARAEFVRILRSGGMVALVWNQRADTPLNRDYADMLERLAPDYANVREGDRSSEAKMRAFFAPISPRSALFANEQRLDEQGLRGRLLSSSFAPPAGHPLHEPILLALAEIFRNHNENGYVTIAYETVVWYGPLT